MKRKQRKYPMRPIGAPGYTRQVGRFVVMSASYKTAKPEFVEMELLNAGPVDVGLLRRHLAKPVVITYDTRSELLVVEVEL